MYVPVWHTDCLPDDIYLSGKCQSVHYRGSYEKIRTADSADLCDAGDIFPGSDHGCVYGGAGGRLSGGFIHCSPVYLPV